MGVRRNKVTGRRIDVGHRAGPTRNRRGPIFHAIGATLASHDSSSSSGAAPLITRGRACPAAREPLTQRVTRPRRARSRAPLPARRKSRGDIAHFSRARAQCARQGRAEAHPSAEIGRYVRGRAAAALLARANNWLRSQWAIKEGEASREVSPRLNAA